jgi:hypothetical protein
LRSTFAGRFFALVAPPNYIAQIHVELRFCDANHRRNLRKTLTKPNNMISINGGLTTVCEAALPALGPVFLRRSLVSGSLGSAAIRLA